MLVSPMVMNAWNNSGMRNVFAENGADYRGAMESVAKNRKCAFVDLNMKSYNMFKQFSSTYNQRFFYNTYPKGEYANYPNGSTDNTHFQEMGALTLCRFIIEELTANKDPYISALQRYMKPMYQVTVKANIDKPGEITTSAKFPVGAPVTAKVLPASGTTFQSWNQDGSQKSKTTIYRFTMPAKATTVTAMFKGGKEEDPGQSPSETIRKDTLKDGQKKIAYITDPTDATYVNDIISPMLMNVKEFYVEEIDCNSATSDLSGFDMVLISEITPSTAPIIANLEGINKPILNMKVHAYKTANGAWSWATAGFGDNTTATTIYVDEEFRSLVAGVYQNADPQSLRFLHRYFSLQASLDYNINDTYLKTSGDDRIIIATERGMAICFDENDVRPMGRDAGGVRGIRLEDGDYVIGACVVEADKDLLTVTKNGFGKRTELTEYLRTGPNGEKIAQGRGGKGLKNYNITPKTGIVAGCCLVGENDDVMLIENGGVIIRIPANTINVYKRDVQGVIVMRVEEGNQVVAVQSVAASEETEEA